MKTKFIATVLLAAQVSLFASPAFADPPQPTTVAVPLVVPTPPASEPDVGTALSPIRKSQPAPFTGVLVSPGGVASLIAELSSIKTLVKIEVDKARADEQARAQFQVNEVTTHADADKQIAQAQLDARSKEITLLTDQLKKAEENKSNTPLWTGIGFGAGIVITVLTVVVINKASK